MRKSAGNRGGRWLLASLLGLALTTFTLAAPPPENVQFETVDEVTLRGTYYPSDLGTKAPCALILPHIGTSHQHPGWQALAERLQYRGYAVLLFDYRGHGASTAVSPAFWKVAVNNAIKGANLKKSDIHVKDFPPSYLPMLVNDIAAARRYLDTRNDLERCNSSNLLLIGEREGATLGTLWLATEWRRRPSRENPGGGELPQRGQEVMCGVWLSMSPTLGRAPVSTKNFAKWMQSLRERTPMAFIYGTDDMTSARYAKAICEQILQVDTPPRLKLTAGKGVKTTAAGVNLLQKGLDVDKLILNYVDNIRQEREDLPWVDHQIRKEFFDFVSMKAFGFAGP
ncbi:MAG: hypothetical protein ACK4RK_05580 [Gemmataceae bacterium]